MSPPELQRPERLFIGVPVTTDAAIVLTSRLPGDLPGKPVAPDKWHFTLRFLGATAPEAREQIVHYISQAKLGASFRIRFSSLGAFPNPRRARILWLGVSHGAERLSALAAVAEAAARTAGFSPEKRGFTPHLTLSRIDPPQNIAALVAASGNYDVEMAVSALILYRSRLGGGPARYEEVSRFELS